MKKILYIFIMLFLLYEASLSGNNTETVPNSLFTFTESSQMRWNSEFYSFDQNSSLDNRYQYNLPLSTPARYPYPSKPSWNFFHTGSWRKSRNERFQRSSYSHNFQWVVEREDLVYDSPVNFGDKGLKLTYSLIFDHQKATDEAKPDRLRYKVSQTKRNAGFNVILNSSDLFLLQSQLKYVKSDEMNNQHLDHSIVSEGYQTKNKLFIARNFTVTEGHTSNQPIDLPNAEERSLRRTNDGIRVLVDAYLDQLQVDYDYYRNYGLESRMNLPEQRIQTQLNFDKNTRKIYLLDNILDTHTRTNYRASLKTARELAEGMDISFSNNFLARDNRLVNNKNRNYLDKDNQTGLNTSYSVWKLRFLNNVGYNYFSRSFRYDEGSRKQLQNIFTTGVSYIHNRQDSLLVRRKLSLTKTDYAVSSIQPTFCGKTAGKNAPTNFATELCEHGFNKSPSNNDSVTSLKEQNAVQSSPVRSINRLDNDLLTDETQISLYLSLKDRIRLINHFYYTTREEVYLSAHMSGNNKVSTSYSLLPSLEIIINDNLRMRQGYNLRADYDDFTWEEFYSDKMFRRFSASYSILTNFPITRGTTISDLSFVSPDPHNVPLNETGKTMSNEIHRLSEDDPKWGRESFSMNLHYTYETNDSGVLNGDKYEIYAENVYHTLKLDLIRYYSRIDLLIQPRFIWSNSQYEFNHILEMNYSLPGQAGLARLSLNPTGNSIKDMLWRINFSLEVGW